MTDNAVNDELQELWNRGRITDYALVIQTQYNKVVEQNKQLQQELREKTAECEELKIKLIQKDEVNAFFNTPLDGWSSNPCTICESKNEYLHYKQVLDEIKKLITDNDNYFTKDILDIIRKQKDGEENE